MRQSHGATRLVVHVDTFGQRVEKQLSRVERRLLRIEDGYAAKVVQLQSQAPQLSQRSGVRHVLSGVMRLLPHRRRLRQQEGLRRLMHDLQQSADQPLSLDIVDSSEHTPDQDR
jgi:hypothetical protein